MLEAIKPLASVCPPEEPLGPIATLRAVQRNALEALPGTAYTAPQIYNSAGRGSLLLMEPQGIRHVLRDNAQNYQRDFIAKRMITPGDGVTHLALAEGEEWRKLRRLIAPTYAPRLVENHAPAMTRAADALAGRILTAGRPQLDIYSLLRTASRDVIASIAISSDTEFDLDAFTGFVDRGAANHMKISLLDLLGIPEWVPRPNRMFNVLERQLNAMFDDVVSKRLEGGPMEPPDLLDIMIAKADQKVGRPLTRAELRSNLVGIMFAGLETTALGVCWALYILSRRPDMMARLSDEVCSWVRGDAATAEDVQAMPYLSQVIKETLRLYPPAGLVAREALGPDSVAGHNIKPGAQVIIPIYAVHRHDRLWDYPNEFDPDRFAPSNAGTIKDFQYLPFGGGPRICVAHSLALVEMQILLATLLKRFQFRAVPNFEPVPTMNFVLSPGDQGMLLEVTER